jgi:hypothetical protein
MKFKIISRGTYTKKHAKQKQSKNIEKNTYTHERIMKFLKRRKKLGNKVEMQAKGKRKDKNRCKHKMQ